MKGINPIYIKLIKAKKLMEKEILSVNQLSKKMKINWRTAKNIMFTIDELEALSKKYIKNRCE